MSLSETHKTERAEIIARVIEDGGDELRQKRLRADGKLSPLGMTKKDGFYNIFIIGNNGHHQVVRRIAYEIKRRPGRPASGRPRMAQVMFTAREKRIQDMDAAAESSGISRSAWIRGVVYAALDEELKN